MRKAFQKFRVMGVLTVAMLSAGILSACVAPQPAQVVTAEVTEAEVQEPQLPSLFISWPLSDKTLISPPIEVQNQGIEACRARGHDSSFMVHIAIDGDTAIAEFGCRGTD